jgi:hypothetical protein
LRASDHIHIGSVGTNGAQRETVTFSIFFRCRPDDGPAAGQVLRRNATMAGLMGGIGSQPPSARGTFRARGSLTRRCTSRFFLVGGLPRKNLAQKPALVPADLISADRRLHQRYAIEMKFVLQAVKQTRYAQRLG